MASAILYGPHHLGDCGFIRMSTLQGEGQIQKFLKHWRTKSDISKLLRIALAWSQHHAGTSIPILEDVHTSLPWLEARWILSLCEFLKSINAKIEVDQSSTTSVRIQLIYNGHPINSSPVFQPRGKTGYPTLLIVSQRHNLRRYNHSRWTIS